MNLCLLHRFHVSVRRRTSKNVTRLSLAGASEWRAQRPLLVSIPAPGFRHMVGAGLHTTGDDAVPHDQVENIIRRSPLSSPVEAP